jgi:hypothetical protein
MKQLFYLMAMGLFFAACSPVRVALSEDLKQNDEYEVSGRQGLLIKQKLAFGPYRTTALKRSWTRGNSARTGFGWNDQQGKYVNLISTEYINRKQTVNFSMTDGQNESDVFCASRFHARDLQVGRSDNSLLNIALEIGGLGYAASDLFYVQVFLNNEDHPWQLVLDNQAAQARPRKYTGVIAKSRDQFYTLVPITRLQTKGKTGSMLGGSVGYEIQNPAGRAVAAVSLIDKGMVYLGKTTKEERFLLANVCSAILLQQQIAE